MKRKSVRGGAITVASQGATALLGLASTVVLARLLSPDDYGILAMAIAVTSLAGLFRDFGLSAAAIQQATLTHAQQSNLFWANVGLGLMLTVALSAASPLVAGFYQEPEVLWITVTLSITFLIGGISAQSGALLAREMRFGRQAAATLCGAVVQFAVAVVLAVEGFRYWSLAWSQLAGIATTSGLLFALSSFRPGMPSRGTGLKAMLRFGGDITAFNFVNYFQRNLDNILIGRFWGAGPLGVYSRAYALLMFPIINLRGPINTVAFPALSRLRDEPASYRAYYVRVTSVLALLSMPLTAYLFVAAKPVIELLLGADWRGVAPVFSFLALAAFIQPSSSFAGTVMLSLGQGQRYFRVGLFNAVIVSISFVIGLPWGPAGVALSYAVANYLVLYPWLAWAFRESPVSFRDFASACTFPAIASVVAVAVASVSLVYAEEFSPIVQVGISLGTFLTAFTLATAATAAGRRHVAFVASLPEYFKSSPRR